MKSLRTPVFWYRIARKLATLRVPVVPSCIDYAVRFVYGCWLPHSALLGSGVTLAYGGLGCVIHGAATIGNNVHIGTNVLIGGNGRQFGVPEIADNVYIGASAVVLGPIRVGEGSIIGANAVVVTDIPPRSVATGSPARVVHQNISISEYLVGSANPLQHE